MSNSIFDLSISNEDQNMSTSDVNYASSAMISSMQTGTDVEQLIPSESLATPLESVGLQTNHAILDNETSSADRSSSKLLVTVKNGDDGVNRHVSYSPVKYPSSEPSGCQITAGKEWNQPSTGHATLCKEAGKFTSDSDFNIQSDSPVLLPVVPRKKPTVLDVITLDDSLTIDATVNEASESCALVDVKKSSIFEQNQPYAFNFLKSQTKSGQLPPAFSVAQNVCGSTNEVGPYCVQSRSQTNHIQASSSVSQLQQHLYGSLSAGDPKPNHRVNNGRLVSASAARGPSLAPYHYHKPHGSLYTVPRPYYTTNRGPRNSFRHTSYFQNPTELLLPDAFPAYRKNKKKKKKKKQTAAQASSALTAPVNFSVKNAMDFIMQPENRSNSEYHLTEEEQDVVMKKSKLIIFLDLDNDFGFFSRMTKCFPERVFVWGFHGVLTKWFEPARNIVLEDLKRRRSWVLHVPAGHGKNSADFRLHYSGGQAHKILDKHITFMCITSDRDLAREFVSETERLGRYCKNIKAGCKGQEVNNAVLTCLQQYDRRSDMR